MKSSQRWQELYASDRGIRDNSIKCIDLNDDSYYFMADVDHSLYNEWEMIRNDRLRQIPTDERYTYPYFHSIHSAAYSDVTWRVVLIPSNASDAKVALLFLIRKGIPDRFRQMIWTKITLTEPNPDKYRLHVDSILSHPKQKVHLFPNFGCEFNRRDYNLTDVGYHTFKRILVIIAMENPDIGFCPLLPHITALLLHYLDESAAYNVLMSLVNQSKKSSTYFYNSREEYKLFLLSFDDIVEQKISAVFSIMTRLGITTLEEISKIWLLNFFSGYLPLRIIFHVLDCYLNEGVKILYRIGIGILNCARRSLETAKKKEQFFEILKTFCYSIENDDNLFKKAFSTRLSRKEFSILFQENTAHVHGIRASMSLNIFYRPKLDFPSEIISLEELEIIWSYLPSRFCIKDPLLLFSSKQDGVSLRCFCQKAQNKSPLIGLFSVRKYSFGFFSTSSLSLNRGAFGDAECFLFQLRPNPEKFPSVFMNKESNEPEYNGIFMYSDNNSLSFGVSKEGTSLHFDFEFNCTTSSSLTFNNPPLFSIKKKEFSKNDETTKASEMLFLNEGPIECIELYTVK